MVHSFACEQLSFDTGGSLRIWKPSQITFTASQSWIRSVGFIDNHTCATSDIRGDISVHDVAQHVSSCIRKNHTFNQDEVYNKQLSSIDNLLFSHCWRENTVEIINLNDLTQERFIQTKQAISDFAPDTDTKTAYFISLWNTLEKCDIETDAKITTCVFPQESVEIAKPSEDTHTLVIRLLDSDCKDNGTLLLDDRTLERKSFLKKKGNLGAFPLPKTSLIAVEDFNTLETFEERTLTAVAKISITRISKIAADPLGRYIAYVTRSSAQENMSTIHLCTTQTLQEVWNSMISNISCDCNNLEFSPDGQQLALGTSKGDVLLFRVSALVP